MTHDLWEELGHQIQIYLNSVSLADVCEGRIYPGQNTTAAQVSAGAMLVRELLTNDIKSMLKVNNYFGVLQGVVNDLGIGVLPDYVTEMSDNLVRVLPDVESNEVPVYLAYPEELRHSKRIAAFRDLVTDEIAAHRRRQKQVESAG